MSLHELFYRITSRGRSAMQDKCDECDECDFDTRLKLLFAAFLNEKVI